MGACYTWQWTAVHGQAGDRHGTRSYLKPIVRIMKIRQKYTMLLKAVLMT